MANQLTSFRKLVEFQSRRLDTINKTNSRSFFPYGRRLFVGVGSYDVTQKARLLFEEPTILDYAKEFGWDIGLGLCLPFSRPYAVPRLWCVVSGRVIDPVAGRTNNVYVGYTLPFARADTIGIEGLRVLACRIGGFPT